MNNQVEITSAYTNTRNSQLLLKVVETHFTNVAESEQEYLLNQINFGTVFAIGSCAVIWLCFFLMFLSLVWQRPV